MLALFVKSSITVAEFVPISGILRGFRKYENSDLGASERSKVFIQTHGCQMNEYDSARMGDLLKDSHGMEQTQNAEEADVLLLNTCSIREKAQEKVFHLDAGKP